MEKVLEKARPDLVLVQESAKDLLGSHRRAHLITPLDYVPFANMMARSYLVLSDSGGIQEEAPAMGKPVLVLRTETERPEAVAAYPALDVSYAIFGRIHNRTPLFKADQGHIHHVLLSLGFSVRKTTLLIYGANIIFALLAVVLLGLDLAPPLILVIGVLTALLVILFFRRLLQISHRNGLSNF